MLRIHVPQLGYVEERRRVVDIFEGESLHDILYLEYLDPIRMPPTEEGQIVVHRLGQEALSPVGLDRNVVTPLGDLFPLRFTSIGKCAYFGSGTGDPPSRDTDISSRAAHTKSAFGADGRNPPPGSRA